MVTPSDPVEEPGQDPSQPVVDRRGRHNRPTQRVIRKRWRTRPPSACPICQPNIDAGWIRYEDNFPSGHAFPPAHMNCDCYVEIRL